MNELKIFNALKEAWETSTRANNRFGAELACVCAWDAQYFADGSYCYDLGGFSFFTPDTDPFGACASDWPPFAIFSDGSHIQF